MKRIPLYFLFSALAMYFIQACKGTDDFINDTRIISLKVSVQGEQVDDQGNIHPQASMNGQSVKNTGIHKEQIPFDDDYVIVAELTPEIQPNKVKATSKLSSIEKTAAAVTTPIQRIIKFRLVVYDKDGNYKDAKIYNINASGNVSPEGGTDLQLNSGQYTFVAYSYNNNTAPTENLVGTNINASMSVNPNLDFMFFNSGLITVSWQQNNNLNVILKHKLTSINVVVDASLTNGYNVSSVGSTTLGTSRGAASINLSSGVLTPSGSTSNKSVSFPSLGTAVVTSTPVLLNNNITNGSLVMQSLTVGPLNRTTPINLSNITIQPGVKYNLVLKITPEKTLDETITVGGVPAVRINGKVWMRLNLGVPNSGIPLDPDVMAQNRIGNYYQWGRSAVVANSTTGSSAPNNTWNSNYQSNGAWMGSNGSEANPVKNTTNDPCPSGWRVPTRAEWDDLIANTTQLQAHNLGTNWTSNSGQYSNAKVLRSKRDFNVKLTFPTAGYYDNNRNLNVRGNLGAYWTSTESGTANTSIRVLMGQTDGNVNTGFGSNNRTFGLNIRCIQQ